MGPVLRYPRIICGLKSDTQSSGGGKGESDVRVQYKALRVATREREASSIATGEHVIAYVMEALDRDGISESPRPLSQKDELLTLVVNIQLDACSKFPRTKMYISCPQ